MAIIKCKMCGGDLNLIEGQSVAECEYCGTRQTVPSADSEKKLTLFARANRLRAACEFDKAAGIYEAIVADFPEEAEAYWGLVLCKYGIEYVDDPASGKKIPTCHRSSFDSVMDDTNFEQAQENADEAALRVYRQEAKQIEGIRKGILEVSSSEKPYDIFICYKETDSSGDRTIDSLLAQDIYDALTGKGYRVFFSRITLEDKLGQAYEPYIFAALNSAKIMLAVGTCYEHYNAVWVKNEWSRYLKIIAQDKNKYLIPCYKNIDAYDIPKEFVHLQGQDMGKVGAIQDLLRGIEKLLPRKAEPSSNSGMSEQTTNPGVAPLLERAYMFLEDSEWDNATAYCERVLDLEPKNAMAYLGKFLAELRLTQVSALKTYTEAYIENVHYKKVRKYASAELNAELDEYLRILHERKLDEEYEKALKLFKQADSESTYTIAAGALRKLIPWKDSEKLYQECNELLEQICLKREEERKNKIYKRAKNLLDTGVEVKIQEALTLFESISGWLDSDEIISSYEQYRNDAIYNNALKIAERGTLGALADAIHQLKRIADWKDSKQRIVELYEQLDIVKQQEKAEEAERIRRIEEEKAIRLRKEEEKRNNEEKRQAEERRRNWRNGGKCQHCGGDLKGLFSKKCVKCGKSKDY